MRAPQVTSLLYPRGGWLATSSHQSSRAERTTVRGHSSSWTLWTLGLRAWCTSPSSSQSQRLKYVIMSQSPWPHYSRKLVYLPSGECKEQRRSVKTGSAKLFGSAPHSGDSSCTSSKKSVITCSVLEGVARCLNGPSERRDEDNFLDKSREV